MTQNLRLGFPAIVDCTSDHAANRGTQKYNQGVRRSCPQVLVLWLIYSLQCDSRPAAAQTVRFPQPSWIEVSADPSAANCFRDPFGSRLVRTPELGSPNGRFRARAQTEVIAFRTSVSAEGPACANTSRLFVAGRQGPGEELVYLLAPRRWELGNSLRVVDWSPDSRRLLIEVSYWQYQSDVTGQAVLLYDTVHGTFDTPDVTGILAKKLGRSCEVQFSVKGFSADGDIVIEMKPYHREGTDSEPGCLTKEGLWLLNWDRETLEPLASGVAVQHYGKWMPQPRAGNSSPDRGSEKKK